VAVLLSALINKHGHSGVQRGANGALAPGIQGRGHPKSEITKI